MIKLKVTSDIKSQICTIIKGIPTPFLLRKKSGQDAFEMVFHTKPKLIRKGDKVINNNIRVTIPYQKELKKGCYYVIDKNMIVMSTR